MLSRLGEGGMGTVYLCEHAVLHRRFAVKVLRADHAADAECVDRFRNEAIAASRIGQENVVDVVDFGTDEDGSLYYVMEALEGRSLGAVIREEGPLPVSRALDVLEQICKALGAAHARGVVHRDVKPDNVFLVRRPDGSDRAKVIDFGISRVPGSGERITLAGAIIGTPEYMAPEQATGGAVDHRADVYAVGVLAFEMLTGALPLEAPTPLATIAAHRTLPPDPPSRRVVGIPPEVDALVLRALAKRPEDRFTTMSEIADEAARIRASLASDLDRPWEPLGGAVTPPRRPSGAFRPSRPRADTVSLPGATPGAARPLRRAGAVLAVALGALAAGWAWRAATEARAPANATTTSAPIPASPAATPPPARAAPLAVPAPALVPVDVPAPAGPVLVGAPPQPVASPLPEDARPARAKAPRDGGRAAETPGGELKDPYADDAKADGAELKDPFR